MGDSWIKAEDKRRRRRRWRRREGAPAESRREGLPRHADLWRTEFTLGEYCRIQHLRIAGICPRKDRKSAPTVTLHVGWCGRAGGGWEERRRLQQVSSAPRVGVRWQAGGSRGGVW